MFFLLYVSDVLIKTWGFCCNGRVLLGNTGRPVSWGMDPIHRQALPTKHINQDVKEVALFFGFCDITNMDHLELLGYILIFHLGYSMFVGTTFIKFPFHVCPNSIQRKSGKAAHLPLIIFMEGVTSWRLKLDVISFSR